MEQRGSPALRTGLSPRVRGNPVGTGRLQAVTRSIPACAGEPASIASSAGMPAVYPRVCGGTSLSIAAVGLVVGLSPRVRGNQHRTSGASSRTGSIPACAGEPVLDSLPVGKAKVYPRVCGGTVPSLTSPVRRSRSIPACAGEPAQVGQRLLTSKRREVYPRVCGGTGAGMSAGSGVAWAGLSPRVRGNRREKCAAYALQCEVYPRVCGGTRSFAIGSSSDDDGLSPRVRGNRT